MRASNWAPATAPWAATTPGAHWPQLDAGSWHSRAFAGEPLPSLQAIARYCLANGFFLNIEIKPTPGTEAPHRRGRGATRRPPVAEASDAAAADLFQARRSARRACKPQPELPRGLLLDTLWTGWLETALTLDCVAVVCNHALWDTSSVTQAKSAGFRTLSYTVNDEWAAQRLIALGTDGIITDRVDLFTPLL